MKKYYHKVSKRKNGGIYMTKKIGIFVGSLRKDSFNKLVAKTMADLFPADFEPVFINIGDFRIIQSRFG